MKENSEKTSKDTYHDILLKLDNNNNIFENNDDISLESNLCLLTEMKSLHWIFVGGKGGVGKTTTSCSIAVELSKHRETVLILSTDPAHNLSDAFTQQFSSTPSLVNGFNNLYAMEIDHKMNETAEFKLQQQNSIGNILPELIQALPGIDEALSFSELMQYVQSMTYSVIVFDTAPTGHTLRLLSFPDIIEKGLNKILSLRDKMSGALNMVNAVSGQSLKEDEVNLKLDNLKAVTTSIRKTFQDPTKTTFVCVCIPEFLSVYETERLVQELAKQGIDCSHIVINQVIFPITTENELQFDVFDTSKNNVIKDISNKNDNEIDDDDNYMKSLLAKPDIEMKNFTDTEKIEKLKLLVKKYYCRASALESSFYTRRRMQSKYLSQIDELYSYDFHVVTIPQQQTEVRGVKKLKRFGNLLMHSREMPIL